MIMRTIKYPRSDELQQGLRRAIAAAMVLVLVLALATVPAAAQTPLKSGDILIADSFAALLKCDPNSGQTAVVASGGPLVRPFGIALDPQEQINSAK